MTMELSPHERERFGITAARCFLTTPEQMGDAEAFCRANGVQMAIIRCRTDRIDVAQAVERAGGALMDCLVYYRLPLVEAPAVDANPHASARVFEWRDKSAVDEIAAAAFEGYFGHYHADPRLDARAADEAYRDWARNSCTPDTAIVAQDTEDRVVGFASLRKTAEDEHDAALFAVDRAARRKGIFTLLLQAAVRFAWDRGSKACTYSTQITNVAANRAIVRSGFAFDYALYTFHKWFDGTGG